MFIKASRKVGIVVTGRQWSNTGRHVKNKQYLTTIQTERTELNRELMRPVEKRTQAKSINKNERQATFQNTKKQGYVQEHKEKEHKEPYKYIVVIVLYSTL
jgi:type IV secretory pathway VirB4 component